MVAAADGVSEELRASGMGLVTAVVVGVTLLAMTLGPVGVKFVTGKPPTWGDGPISGVVNSINTTVNEGGAMYDAFGQCDGNLAEAFMAEMAGDDDFPEDLPTLHHRAAVGRPGRRPGRAR